MAPRNTSRGVTSVEVAVPNVDQVAAQGMVLAVKIIAVERLLHRVFVEGGTQVVGHLRRTVDTNGIAEGDE